MDLDLVLAFAHHLTVFSLAGLLAVEFVLLRPGVAAGRLAILGRVDAAYGGLAALVIVIGILRVLFGASGWEYYAANWAFWAKMAAFAGVGILSVPPTIAIIRWRRAGIVPAEGDVAKVRRYLWLELGLFALIPLFAAMMARGYGA